MSIRITQSLHSEPIDLQRLSHYPAMPAPTDVPLTVLPPQPCPYLAERFATIRAFQSGRIDPEIYHDFMDAGFRRSGHMVYQNVCRRCRQCTQIRMPVALFKPSKSQRRCMRRNRDLAVNINRPRLTHEKFALYERYLSGRHDSQQDSSAAGLESFLYDSPVQSVEFEYRDGWGKLVAVGICDICSRSLSSVYFYFDPEHARRGLGNFGVLYELEFARRMGIEHYYLGFWVAGSAKMQYKATYGPFELLGTDGIWRPGAL